MLLETKHKQNTYICIIRTEVLNVNYKTHKWNRQFFLSNDFFLLPFLFDHVNTLSFECYWRNFVFQLKYWNLVFSEENWSHIGIKCYQNNNTFKMDINICPPYQRPALKSVNVLYIHMWYDVLCIFHQIITLR